MSDKNKRIIENNLSDKIIFLEMSDKISNENRKK